jgi:hypothetical protein
MLSGRFDFDEITSFFSSLDVPNILLSLSDLLLQTLKVVSLLVL